MGDAYDIMTMGLTCIGCGDTVVGLPTVEVGEGQACELCMADPSFRRDHDIPDPEDDDEPEEGD